MKSNLKHPATPNDKRKALFFLPLLIIPLLALAFHALGGGGQTGELLNIKAKGINTSLPDATFKSEEPKDKLGFYQKNDRDSAANKQNGIASIAGKLGFEGDSPNPQTQQIDQRIQVLTQEIARAQQAPATSPKATQSANSSMKGDIDRLEALMKSMQQPKDDDPEMKQLNTVLQSIIDIQHPERLTNAGMPQSGSSRDPFRAFRAEIDGKQKVSAGASVRIRLLDTLTLNDHTFLPGQQVFGICRLANHRLLLDIQTIRLQEILLPADLTVYSLDAMPGINAPEAELSEAAGAGADQAMRGVGVGSFDQSMATQAAVAGIDAARSLLSKKVRKIHVTLKNGYPILLRNNQQKIR